MMYSKFLVEKNGLLRPEIGTLAEIRECWETQMLFERICEDQQGY